MKALYTLLVLFTPFFCFSQAPTFHTIYAFDGGDFSPSYLTINQGDTVYFYGLGQSNAVEVSQQVYEDFGTQSNGGFALYADGFVVFDEPGTFYYVSTPFAGQGMVGQITVLESQNLTYVPDDNFELALIDLGYDDVLDNYVVTDSINSVTSLNVGNMQISDLTGIEDFISLNYLYISNNSISSIDLSSNTLLTYLHCGNNQLTTLDLSNNTELYNLFCFSNQLSTLNLSNNTNLYYASIDYNEIENIDLSNSLNLNYFFCSNNLLDNLDLTNNVLLQSLICSGNQLTTLDLSNNSNLQNLDVSSNNLYELNLQNGNCQNFVHYWGEDDIPTNGIISYENGQLDCILVDDSQCAANWSSQFIDPQHHYFSDTCSYGGSDQCDLLIDIVTNDILCSSNNGQFANQNVQGSVSVSLNSSVNLADVVVEIVNLNNQEIFGSILDSFQIYTQILAPGSYLLNAYLPNTNCFYSEYFNIVDYSLDLSYSTTPSSTIYSSDGSIFFNIISGVPDYNVEVYGPNDYYYGATSVNPQFSLDELETGDYYVYITDSLDCFESYQIFLNYNPQTFGCTDDGALNFNPEATVDDGSCNYCSLSLVSVTPTYCNENSASIEVSTFSNYDYDIQILENNNWVSYSQQACIEYLNSGAIIGCLPADTFMVIGYGWNNCVDTLASSTINLTSIIENDQLQMTQIDMTQDDVFSDVINIGFDFVYNGVQYDQCLISSNNFLSFNIQEANMYSAWSINDAIPSAANPLNAIMAPFQDLNPALGGSIYYTTYGTAPNRVFIIRWKDVPMFSCEQELFSSTLYLYEGTNIIETHIQNKPICSQWNEGASIHGLHNSNGTQATVVFDSFANQFRNYPVLWSATNDSWQFSPLDSANGYQVSNIPYGTQYSINADLITTVNGQFGCTDPEALNYSPNSICDDNSCEYPPVLGCTDPQSTNFNELAEINDGSCCYQNSISIVVNTGQEVGQSYWNLVDLNQNDLFFTSLEGYPNNTDSVSTDFICLANACYQLSLIFWTGGSIEIYSSGYQVLSVEPAIGSDLTTIQFCLPIEQLGCTDPLACNFNPFANQDNGSCAYPQVFEQEFIVCDGFELDGQYYQESFVNSETIVLANGCDSVVNTTYTVSYSPDVNMFVDFIDDALTAETNNSDNLLYNWNTNESTQTINIDTNGVYTVTVIDAQSLCSSTSSINVSWLDATSIDDYIASVYDFKVYPNPSSNVFNVSFYSLDEIDLSVNSILGEKIYFEKVRSNGQAYVQIDLSNYSKGIYNLTIKTPDGLSNHKLILQ